MRAQKVVIADGSLLGKSVESVEPLARNVEFQQAGFLETCKSHDLLPFTDSFVIWLSAMKKTWHFCLTLCMLLHTNIVQGGIPKVLSFQPNRCCIIDILVLYRFSTSSPSSSKDLFQAVKDVANGQFWLACASNFISQRYFYWGKSKLWISIDNVHEVSYQLVQ